MLSERDKIYRQPLIQGVCQICKTFSLIFPDFLLISFRNRLFANLSKYGYNFPSRVILRLVDKYFMSM